MNVDPYAMIDNISHGEESRKHELQDIVNHTTDENMTLRSDLKDARSRVERQYRID